MIFDLKQDTGSLERLLAVRYHAKA